MYGLIGSITAAPGQRNALVDILIEGTREMPGCLGYVIATDPSDADTIWITEVWEDEDSHRASLALPTVRRAIEMGKPLIAGFGDRVVTTPVGVSGFVHAPSDRDAG
jgi:quinol monooxygenase YgiN